MVCCTHSHDRNNFAQCRVYRADKKLLLYAGIVQALLAAWALLLSVTAGTQPVIACKSCAMHYVVIQLRFVRH